MILLLTLFFGCGEHAGENEYNKALASWKSGDYSRAQGQMEKAIRKLSDEDIADIRKYAERYIVKMKQYRSGALKPIHPE